MEGSILEFTATVFNEPNPPPPNSIHIQFPEHNIKEVSQELLQCLTEALKLWHGDQEGKVDLNSLSVQDFERVNYYFNSFGIRVILDKFHEDDYDSMIERHFSQELLTVLKDFRFKLKVDQTIYVIYFDFASIN